MHSLKHLKIHVAEKYKTTKKSSICPSLLVHFPEIQKHFVYKYARFPPPVDVYLVSVHVEACFWWLNI
jgi:hypothetical protein